MKGFKARRYIYIIRMTFIFTICTIILFAGKQTAFANEADSEKQTWTDSQGVIYSLNEDGTCEVSGGSENLKKKITIPSSVEFGGKTYAVKRIERNAFNDNEIIEHVVLPEGMEEIGRYGFFWCESLITVGLPKSLLRIADDAFQNCTYLENIELPEGLTYFGGFSGCRSIKSIRIPASVTEISLGAFDRCDSLEMLQIQEGNQYYFADEQGLVYNKSGNELYVAAPLKETVVIPQIVKDIGDGAFRGNNKLTSVTVPGTVKRIGSYAFQSCGNLKEVILEEGVEELGWDRVFAYCENLEKIVLPASLKEIGESTFARCRSLKEVVLDENSPYFCTDEAGNIYSKNMDTLVSVLYSVTEFCVPDTVKIIGPGAFNNGLVSNVTLPEGLEEIHSSAFDWTEELSSLELPSTLTYIGSLVFQGSGVNKLKIPLSVTYVDEDAFYRVGHIYAYAGTAAEMAAVSNGIEFVSLGNRVFTDEQGVKYTWDNDAWSVIGYEEMGQDKIVIPEYIVAEGITDAENGKSYPVNKVSDWAFNQGLSSGIDIELPERITSIGKKSFADNFFSYDAKLIVQPGSYAEVYAKEMGITYCYAERESEGYRYQLLEDGTISITGYSGNESELIIPKTLDGKDVSVIEWCAFSDCGNVTYIKIPDSVTAIDGHFLDCISLKSIEVDSENENYTSEDGILYDKEKTCVICCPQGKRGSVALSEGVLNIGNSAFCGCSSLTEVLLPQSVASIGENAFTNCSSLTNMVLPKKLEKFGSDVFAGCSSLKSVNIPENVINIGHHTFMGCKNLTSIKIPDGVIAIDLGAFDGCSSMTSIEIPFSMRSIFNLAFSGCISLEDIFYSGSREQWEKISFGEGNDPIYNAKIHYNYNAGEITCSHTYKSTVTTQPTCTRTGVKTYTCTKCNHQYNETIARTNHTYINGKCKLCGQIAITASDVPNAPDNQKTVPLAKGKTFTDSKTKYRFKVTSPSAAKPTAAFAGTVKKEKKVTIPPSVTYQGITYQVTSVSAKALKGNTKITSLVVGKNITKIEKNAFEGCKNLNSITVKSKKLRSVGKNALKGIHKKCRIKVPSAKLKTYKKLFKKKGQKSSVKIGK